MKPTVLIIAAAVLLGAAYYFFVVKPKRDLDKAISANLTK